jgi:hypothetical protein
MITRVLAALIIATTSASIGDTAFAKQKFKKGTCEGDYFLSYKRATIHKAFAATTTLAIVIEAPPELRYACGWTDAMPTKSAALKESIKNCRSTLRTFHMGGTCRVIAAE